MKDQPIINAQSLSKSYENDGVITPVLNDLTFTIPEGQFVAIMGPSGSGKSTLMHILGFLDKASSGSYVFQNKNVSTLSDDALAVLRGNKVGFIFQAFHLLSKASVRENVMLPLLYSDIPNEERMMLAEKAIAAVGLSHRADHGSHQLSGGERQRVAIARALIRNPAVIFADEPTGNLDSKSGAQVMNILQELNLKHDHTIVLVTHETYTSEHAERILRIKDGMIESDDIVRNRRLSNGDVLVK